MRTDRLPASRVLAIGLALPLALAACEPEDPVPYAPPRDARVELVDSGPVFQLVDSGIDAGPTPDAGVADDGGGADGSISVPLPSIDGTISEGEWDGALEAVSARPASGGDQLTRVRAIRTASRLLVAIEGTIATGHAIAMYLDTDFGGPRGVLLSSGSELADFTGTLDRALSASLISGFEGTLLVEYAWGTTAMPSALGGSSDTVGWRDIETSQTDYRILAAGNTTACSATACETSMLIGAGGITGDGPFALFVRSTDALGALTQQSLPEEPEAGYVTEVLTIPAPAGSP